MLRCFLLVEGRVWALRAVAFSFGMKLCYISLLLQVFSLHSGFFLVYDFSFRFVFLSLSIFSVFFVFFRADEGYWKIDRPGAFGVTWVIL